MKRIFLSMPILAMVTMIALFSCNKEEIEKTTTKIDSNNIIAKTSIEHYGVFNNTNMLSDLSNEGIDCDLNSLTSKYLGKSIFLFQLPIKSQNENFKRKLEVLVDTSQNKMVPLIKKTISSKDSIIYSYSFLGNGDIIGSVIQTGDILTPTIDCSSMNSFNDCFSCAWEQLTNDWVGIAACATNPWACIGASALYCALLSNHSNVNVYNY